MKIKKRSKFAPLFYFINHDNLILKVYTHPLRAN